MSLETITQGLVDSTNALLVAVNTRKTDLDSAATTAVAAASTATIKASEASSSATSAADYAAQAAASAGTAVSGGIRYDTAQSLTAPEKLQARNNIGLAAVAASGAYADLTGKPTALSAFANDSGFLTSSVLSPYLTSASAAATYQPIGSYLTGINSSQVTTALGFTPANKAGDTFSGNVQVSNGTDSRLNLQVSGVTEGILTASATNVRLSSANAIPMTFGTNGVTRLTMTGTGYITTGASEYVGIGAQANTNNALRIARNIENGTSAYAVLNDGTFQAGVTTQGAGFRSVARTAAAAFTMASLQHYQAVQATLGAGSAITTQSGFVADASLTGATNNYGFHGNIPSGTGRYNLYMAGTAANYLAGALQVDGGITGNLTGNVTGNVSGTAATITGLYGGTLTSGQVTGALGFTPYDSANPSGFITSAALSPYLTTVSAAATYQPIGAYLTGINSSQVTTALGFTPYSAANPAGYTSNVGDVTLAGNQTLTNKTLDGAVLNKGYTEEVFAVTGTTPALSPTNGSIQTWTLSGASTPTAGTWASGQSITLMVDDGAAFAITWTSLAVTWKTNGGSAPTLAASGATPITLWTVGTTIYGARVGDA